MLSRVPGESISGGPYMITQGTLSANNNYTLSFTHGHLSIIKGIGSINDTFYYRAGNFWHISHNLNNADPGFDVMRGTNDQLVRLDPSDPSKAEFDKTWHFPQQFEVEK